MTSPHLGAGREGERCECFHVISRHNSYGCRYCDCTRQPPSIEEAIQRVADQMDAEGEHELAATLRLSHA